MWVERWFYDLQIYIYLISLLMALADFVRSNPLARRTAFVLLWIIWLMQSADILWHLIHVFTKGAGINPLILYTWALITFAVCIYKIFGIDLFALMAAILGFMTLSIQFFFVYDMPLVETQVLMNELIFIHVSLAYVAYAAFSLTGTCAIIYLLAHRWLKKKKWNRFLARIPSLDQLHTFGNWLMMVGLVFLFGALVLGILWASQNIQGWNWLNLKLIVSVFIFLYYLWLFYKQATQQWLGQRLAWWNALGFLFLIGNYLIAHSHLSIQHGV